MTRAIMIQGAGSNVGKSLFVAGIARHFANQGLKVRPFKPQNMSNNAAVTSDGGEIGRAQALQARAARIAPTIDMNPILLKPETDSGAQVIVQGKRFATMKAREYGREKHLLMPKIVESFRRLASGADLVIVEGAGSPAEVNLRHGDLANMGFAQAVDIPVVLVGDIDRGGVIAQLVGTHAVLDPGDRDRIKAFSVNKFRGDISLFSEGASRISQLTGWADLGTLPWFADAWRLPAEDIMDISSRGIGKVRIAVPRLGRIANFDDLDPLSSEADVSVEVIEPGRPLPGNADLVLIPGSKSTIADLEQFRTNGWDIDLFAHRRRGGAILGICGGYQMLGRRIHDPDGIEGRPGSHDGLGLLDVETRMTPSKTVTQARGHTTGSRIPVSGYEIHIGETSGPDCDRAWLEINGNPQGAKSPDGLVSGCYIHGLFTSDAFRAHVLAGFGGNISQNHEQSVDDTLDALARHMAGSLDLDRLLSLTVPVGKGE